MEDRTRAAWEALKERLTTDAPSPETFTPNPLDVNLLGSGLSLRGLGHFLGTTRAEAEVAAEPIT